MKLITREGYTELKEEFAYLWKTERPEITKIVTWAAGLGDRSDNADYKENKRRLREIDRRIRYLIKTFEYIRIVDYDPQQDGKIFFGAWVELQNYDDEILKFRIVGPDEIYKRNDYISFNSPIASACLKKSVDDEVIVKTPSGDTIWYVNSIDYKN
jgi:transcription elongation factor GreB